MAEVEQEMVNAGAEIIWVLEQDGGLRAGTAESCRTFMDDQGSKLGWCVGDGETQPTAGTFDKSPFSVARGFDIIVPTSTMTVDYSTSHGTPNGNDNPSGQDVLDALNGIVGE